VRPSFCSCARMCSSCFSIIAQFFSGRFYHLFGRFLPFVPQSTIKRNE
jgi:hypothetical protein